MRNKRVLFVCHLGRMRSRTAAEVFAGVTRLDTDFAGTGVEAVRPVSAELIAWADTILVMENRHRKKLKRRFGEKLAGKYIRVLGIPDEYDYL